MGLVSISRAQDSIEDRNALFQKGRGPVRAFDLMNGAQAQPGNALHAALDRAARQIREAALQGALHQRIADEQPSTDEPLQKNICIFKGRDLPGLII
jgi:hypothetical protein